MRLSCHGGRISASSNGKAFDLIVHGGGEDVIVELAFGHLEGVKGTIHYKNGKITDNGSAKIPIHQYAYWMNREDASINAPFVRIPFPMKARA